MAFSIKLTPESQAKINKLSQVGKIDLRPVLKVVGIGYRKEVKQIFDKQQPRAEGLRWPQLDEKYAAQKEREFPGQNILVRTGSLIESMTREGADGNISIIGKKGAIFGSSISYGIYHDIGGEKIPRRNFSEASERRKKIWLDQIERSIIHNFEKNGVDVEGKIFE